MNELLVYSALLLFIIGHCTAAAILYREINADPILTFREKNSWKLRSLIAPAFYWYYYRQEKKRRIS